MAEEGKTYVCHICGQEVTVVKLTNIPGQADSMAILGYQEPSELRMSRLIFALAARRFVLAGKGWGERDVDPETEIAFGAVLKTALDWLKELGDPAAVLMQESEKWRKWTEDIDNNEQLRDLGAVLSLMMKDEALGLRLRDIHQ